MLKDLRDWVDVAFKVVLAATGVVVGYFFSFQKQQNEDIRLVVDMATAAEEPKRIMAGSIAKAYYEQNRIPQDFYVAVFDYANRSQDAALTASVNSGVGASAKTSDALRRAVTQATAALPARIYFHIRDEGDRSRAKALQEKIAGTEPGAQPIIVPGIELVPGQQRSSELRCFKKSECETLGPRLIERFKEAGAAVELRNLSERYETSGTIRPNHFEAWLARGIP